MSNILDEKWRHISDKIKILIYECEHFTVFVDQNDLVYWETADSYDERGGHKDISAWHAFLNASAFTEIMPCSHLEPSVKSDFKRLIAEATARALEHEYASANQMLQYAENFLIARNQETSRFWYLSGSAFITGLILIFGLILWMFKAISINLLGHTLFWVLIAASAGALGALLSIILRMGKAELDCSSGQNLHYLEAVSRIVAGGISGAIGMLAIKAEVVGPAILSVSHSVSGQIIFAFIVGASERFIPSIISNFEVEDKNLKLKAFKLTEDN